MQIVFDCEADGLLDEATRIHVLAWNEGGDIQYTHNYDEMREVLSKATALIGHNIIMYDVPLLERLLNIKIKARLIDTLALSWYLYPNRMIHGLEAWGVDLGFPKPQIDNWKDLSPEEYRHRCVEDVKNNTALWNKISNKLDRLYDDRSLKNKLINYLSFKMTCAHIANRQGFVLDVELVNSSLKTLYAQQAEKLEQLIAVMPRVKKTVSKSRPKKPFLKNGTYSAIGAKWFKLLRDNNLPEDYMGDVEVVVGEVEPNPNSSEQVKNWLFSLGWEPETFKFVRTDNGERKIPQVRVNGELTPCVIRLAEEVEEVRVLEGLSVIQHRISIFESFLKNLKDGKVYADIGGLTNTLRFKHRVPLVNLPGVEKAWGPEIRGALTVEEGWVVCGSDVVSLEDNTKRHFMYQYDPEYVKEMSAPDFDPHLDLAKFAGAITEEELTKWKQEVPEVMSRLKPTRKLYKVGNYSCIYGVGAPKLSRELGIPLGEAEKLIAKYWERNWAIKQLAEDMEKNNIKWVDGEMWLFNPVSKLYYSLRNTKDIFSTLNQGTGVYCFDRWIFHWMKELRRILAQFHDEIVNKVRPKDVERYEAVLHRAMEKVNEELKLNVTLTVDVKFGNNYAEVH